MHTWHLCSLVLWIVAAGGATAGVCHAQATRQPSSPEDRLRSALQRYAGSPHPEFEPSSFLYAFVDLDGTGKLEAVAYLTGRGWCGSGGCRLLVMTQQGPSYKVITMIPAVKLPIRVLESKSHGWRDLSVFIQGGGIIRGYDEIVRFDGNGYREPSDVAPASGAKGTKGKVILSWDDKKVPLYP